MLSREHGIAAYDFQRNLIVPDRLTRVAHAHYLEYAQRMLDVYRTGVGQTRRELHRNVHNIFARADDCPLRRIEAFCKLLDDASQYDLDRHGAAAKLRMKVFRFAASRHPLVQQRDSFFEHSEMAVKDEIAKELNRDWPEIEAELFSDIVDFQRMTRFEGYESPAALLARYNVGQVQVALFDASELIVRARTDFKIILRRAKLARLMHSIRRIGPDEYEFRFDGPASVLRHTRRYGTSMAKFIPSLLACREWTMHAKIRTRRGGWHLSLNLSHADGLSSPQAAPEEFDSQLEESFAERWGTEPVEGWTLHRETAVLCEGQKVFVPDFEFRHEDGRVAVMEVVGFWTPEYIETKRETLKQFQNHHIILAIAHSMEDELPDVEMPRVVYRTALKVKDVITALEAFA